VDHKCPFTGELCPLPKLYHVTDIKDGESETIDICEKCLSGYLDGSKPVEEVKEPEVEVDIKLDPDKIPVNPTETEANDFLKEVMDIVEQVLPDKKVYAIDIGTIDSEEGNNILESEFKDDSFGDPEKECEKCKFKLKDIIKNNKLGCSNCYKVFEEELERILNNAHSLPNQKRKKLKHVGKTPKQFRHNHHHQKQKRKHTLLSLKKQMALAVEKEDYETAAILRDEINAIVDKVNKKSDKFNEDDSS
jgi:protein-arginine kinase activator protein McsA